MSLFVFTTAVPLRFPKSARLSASAEFARMKREGVTLPGRFFVLSYLRHGSGSTRLGLITTRKIGSAVVRNRTRRRLREIFRATLPTLQEGFWIVLIARHRAPQATFMELQEEWCRLASKARLFCTVC